MTFARVYVNFEFSVNEEFVACGTLVETLAILKSSCAKGCYLIQNLNLYLVGCICPVLVINFFKDLVSHTQQKKCYTFSKSNYERKHLLPKHWGKYTLSIGCLSFCIKKHSMEKGLVRVVKILLIVPYATNFSFTDNFNFIYAPVKVFISRPMVIHKLKFRQVFNNNPTLTRTQKSFFKTLHMEQTRLFSPESPVCSIKLITPNTKKYG